jgi:hypothetical protein
MLSVKIRSRIGNVILVGLGLTYALAGTVLLVWSLVSHWGAASPVEYAMVVLLIVATACGIWFASMAFQNLGVRPRFIGLHHA